MPETPRHKVFISYYHDDDQEYKNRFAQMMQHNIVDKSVGDGDIDDNVAVDTVRRKIREDFIADATVTVVLIGSCTWQRKHVDWEIGSSLRHTRTNSRCGLLGILLPTHPSFGKDTYDPRLIPPRLADNCDGDNPYAEIYDWPGGQHRPARIREWVHRAFQRRNGTPPNNSRQQFANNRSGACSRGWQN
jgi:hypothetical protein